jgi:predicted MFS family arabinose efflux permease
MTTNPATLEIPSNGISGRQEPAAWGGVFAMTLFVAALITSEFLPVSLLTPIASGLHITEGQAGQSIAVSGVLAVLASLLTSSVIARFDRRQVILFLTFLTVLSGTVVAYATNAGVLMAGRALLGIVIGGFWSISAAVVMRLVPATSVPKALAILNGGNALAATVAAPVGSFLGSIIGWRGAFFCVVPLSILAFAWQWRSIPRLAPERRESKAGNPFRLMLRPVVAFGMAATMLLFMGQFALFTYVRPFLETATRVGASTLSIILLIMGLTGLIGTFLIGRLLKDRLYSILAAIPFLMAVTALGLIAFGNSLYATALLFAVWGLLGTAAPVGWWAWLSKTLPRDAEAGGGLMVAIIQMAITLGATAGGFLYDMKGYHGTFSASAAILGAAAVMAHFTWRANREKESPRTCNRNAWEMPNRQPSL